jgi:hypothetical protein
MTHLLDELVANPARVDERAQGLEWGELLYEYEHALDDEAALLAGLSDGQLHFKPASQSFSISEAITHALNSDQLLWRWIKLLAEGRRAEIDPAAFVPGDEAQPDRPALPNAVGQVSGAEITALLEAVRLMARGTLELRPDPIDLQSTAPHPHFGELTAKGWVMFMALHHGLHLRQCEAVIDTPGFPRGQSLQSLSREEYLQPRDRKPWLMQETGNRMQDARGRKQTAKKSAVKKKPADRKKPSSGKKSPKAR